MEEGDNVWKVDFHIPVASIIAGFVFILLQTVAVTVVITSVANRVSVLEDGAKASSQQGSQIAVLTEKVTTLQSTVTRLEEWLQRNMPRSQPDK